MNIEETLSVRDELISESETAYKHYQSLKLKADSVLFDNEEPFHISYFDGSPTGISIRTPDDVMLITIGGVVAVNGVEWFHVNNGWLSWHGTQKDDEEMFVRIMRNRNHVHLIHKGC